MTQPDKVLGRQLSDLIRLVSRLKASIVSAKHFGKSPLEQDLLILDKLLFVLGEMSAGKSSTPLEKLDLDRAVVVESTPFGLVCPVDGDPVSRETDDVSRLMDRIRMSQIVNTSNLKVIRERLR